MARNTTSDLQGSYLTCLSLIESNNSVLYTALADRTSPSSVKALLMDIAEDGHKHAAMLKGFANDVVESEAKPLESEKELAEVFGVAYDIYKEVIKKEQIAVEELPLLAEKLSVLEDVLEGKYRFVQSALSVLAQAESVRMIHGLNQDKLERLFAKLVSDRTAHRKLLATVRLLVDENAKETPSTLSGFTVIGPLINPVIQKA